MSDQATLERAATPPNLHIARVETVQHYTERLFGFTCERPAALRFRSGEFVMIGLLADGRPLLRAYSIASPAWDDALAFYSIKAPNGPLTSRLQKIVPGDDILVGRKPTGTLVLDALLPGRRLFLISTGTGFAPFASLIREPETYTRYDEIILTHTCRTAPELVYSSDVVGAAIADPLVGDEARKKLRYLTTLTREFHELEGRITTLLDNGAVFGALGAPSFDPASDRIMICGSAPALRDMKALALSMGFSEGSNHEPGSFVVERAFAA
jgi:ferredoxin--NADP+ reductase